MHVSTEDKTDIISIIVPVYNAEKTLGRCIDSIRRQTYKNIEVIIVDDGSLDNSAQIISEKIGKDSRFIYIKKNNSGVSAARNKGIEIAQGKYISFVDADDYVEENYIEVLYNSLIQYKADISLCYPNDELEAETNCCKLDNKNCVPNCFSINKDYNYLKKGFCHWVSWGALYKRDVIGCIRFDEDLCVAEDSLFFAKVAKKSKRIVHTNQILYHYVVYKNSASHGSFDIKKYSELESWRRICMLFKENVPLYYSAQVAYSIRCRNMILKFYFDQAFTKKYYKEVRKLYKESHKYISKFPKEFQAEKIKGVLFNFLPKCYVILFRFKNCGIKR